MTLAQLEENAIARHPDTAPEVTRGHFRTMASDNYGAKRDEYSDLPLDKLKQLLHDLQLWELTRDAEAFKDLSPTSRESKNVVFAAVERNGEVLRYVCDDLRNDKDIVLAALRQNGQAIKYAGPSLRDDKELAFIALMNDPDCLSELPNDLRGEEETILLYWIILKLR